MPRALTLTLIAGLALGAPAQALAQSNVCQEGGKYLQERQGLVQQMNALSGKKQVDAGKACSVLTKLSANGTKAVTWLEANKDWCQIPDQFAQSFKEDHQRVADLRGKACKAAAQQAEMIKRARQQAQNGGGGGLLGGPGLTGEYKIPQGAL